MFQSQFFGRSCALLTVACSCAFAGPVNKCVGRDGKIVFTDKTCPADTSSQVVDAAHLGDASSTTQACPAGLMPVGCTDERDISVIAGFSRLKPPDNGPYYNAVITRLDSGRCVMFKDGVTLHVVKDVPVVHRKVVRAPDHIGEYWVPYGSLTSGPCTLK